MNRHRSDQDGALSVMVAVEPRERLAAFVADVCEGLNRRSQRVNGELYVRGLIEQGARDVYCFAVHAPMAPGSVELIRASAVRTLVVTDTIPLTLEQKDAKIKVLTVAPLLAEAIRRIHDDVSVSALFT